jgi:uncharacterized membrane protein YqiK
MPEWIFMVGGVIVLIVLVLLGVAVMFTKFYRMVDQGRALIVNKREAEPAVVFTGALVWPIIHRAEVMDISVKTIEIDRRGKEGLICKDNIRGDIKVTFFVRVNKTQDDVLKVAQSIGCARASDPRTLEELFNAKFSEALKTVGKGLNFEDLYKERQQFKDDIIKVIGTDLNGFVLDDAAIDYLEQTPIESLDKDNIMDAEGIRKITDLTVTQNVKTNELRAKERMELGSQNLAADEALFRFEQRKAEAAAKKDKEISVAQSREQNEAARVASEEQKKTLLVQYKNDEEALVANEARERGALVARKAKEREVLVEQERVEKAKQLEVVGREREVEIQRIAKEKEIETKKKEIADVVRARVAVDKTVAEEEERIKDVHALAEANRQKEVVKITAEAEAQGNLVKQIKAAEAAEEVAKFQARQKIVVADADLEASDKSARAKIRMAEGVQAEHAAEGLAEVRVREADAAAVEKRGLVEARITLEKMQAVAAGEEKQGLARVKVKEAEAAAIEKVGLADAHVIREKLVGEAAGEEQKGVAKARVREADAAATEKMGHAEGEAIKSKLVAEAAGIAEKAAAMKALDDASRGHEEFRLRLDLEKSIALETIRNRKDIAEAQAKILSQAFATAKIQIVGGDGQFFDRFVKAIAVGQAVDGVVENSESVRHLLTEVLPKASAPAQAGATKSPTLSALLAQLMTGVDEPSKSKLRALADRAKDLGIDDLTAR